MVGRHCDIVDFAAIYIREAHAVDEWPISEAPLNIRQHQCIRERLDAARELSTLFIQNDAERENRLVWFVDDMKNSFDSIYSSWPFRFWVLTLNTILFKPMPKNATYHLDELDDILSRPTW